MQTSYLLSKYQWLIMAFVMSSVVSGQIIITKPTLTFSFLCQSQFVNTTHDITFTVSPIGNLNPSNVFSLEMSQDNFATAPVIITPQSVVQSGSQFTMTFTLPTSTFGSNHRLRVRSSNPGTVSPSSDPFDAYYIKHNQEIMLNNASGINDISFCAGGSITLFIFNSNTNTSPLFYPELTYVWKKKQLPNDIIVGTGASLSVNQTGEYYVETNYGVCTPSFDSRSRIVTVTDQSSAGLTITSSSGNQICEGTNVTLTGSLTGSAYTYTWYRGNEEILGANSSSYTTTVSGNYKLVADNGTCLAESNVIVLSPITFNSSVTPNSPITLDLGESETITVTTTATNPVFQWYYNGNLLSEISNTLTVNQTGTYTVIINQTSGCIVSEEIEILVQDPQINDIPNLISPNDDGANEKWVLPNSITSQEGINVKIFNGSGKLVLNTDNYENNWPINESDFIDSNSVFFYIISKGDQKIKQGTITVIK